MSKLYSNLNNVSIEVFTEYYFSHNIVDTAKQFSVTTADITLFCKEHSIKKTKEQISNQIKQTKIDKYGSFLAAMDKEKVAKNRITKYGSLEKSSKIHSQKIKESIAKKSNSYENVLNRIDKEAFIKDYITDNHDRKWMLEHYQISEWTLDRLIKDFDCHKSKNQAASIVLQSKYNKYGSREAYYEHVNRVFAEACLAKYGVSNPNKLDWVRKKIEETNLNNIGVPYHCMLPENRPHGSDSTVNIEFANLLTSRGIDYEREYIIENRIYDFKVGDILLEINPTATHNSTWGIYGKGLPVEYHFTKTNLAISHGFRCIHVWDWDDVDKVINLITPRKRVYARCCDVSLIDNNVSKEFVKNNHMQGAANSSISIALTYNNDIVSVMTFGKPRYNRKYEYELIRYCSTCNVVGGAQKLFSYFVKIYSPKSVISYCDLSKFTGLTYVKLGFEKQSESISKHWYNIKTKQHITDNLLRQQGFDRLFDTQYGKGTDNEFLMLENGFVEVYDAGQATYIWKN